VALRLTRDYDVLMRAVPAGERGANVLISLARLADARTDFELRIRCLREAVARDPSKARARLTLARELIESLAGRTNAEACSVDRRQPCIDEVNAQATALESSAEVLEAALMRARLRSALGDPAGAASTLAAECARHAPDKRLACLRIRAELAAAGSAVDFDGAIRELIEAGCSPLADCVETYEWAATVLGAKGDWAGALGYYRRAAKENPTPRNWAGVARSARQLGLTHEAAIADAKSKRPN
jgi:tetratricopeptide (TPR) repeat protein